MEPKNVIGGTSAGISAAKVEREPELNILLGRLHTLRSRLDTTLCRLRDFRSRATGEAEPTEGEATEDASGIIPQIYSAVNEIDYLADRIEAETNRLSSIA